jgi:nucleoid-associated protein YgaU
VTNVDRGRTRDVGPARAALALLALLALTAAAALAVATPDAARAALAPGADTGDLLSGLALLGAWAVTARVALTALAVGLAALPGAVGRLGRAVAAACTPALLRSIVRTALGASVVAGPLLSGTAFADAASPQALPGLPLLDRVMAPASSAPTKAPYPPRPPHTPHTGHPVAASGSGHVVVVRPGDTLWDIAARDLPAGRSAAQIATAWPRWYAANRAVIGPDPGRIQPGERLVPPS